MLLLYVCFDLEVVNIRHITRAAMYTHVLLAEQALKMSTPQ